MKMHVGRMAAEGYAMKNGRETLSHYVCALRTSPQLFRQDGDVGGFSFTLFRIGMITSMLESLPS